MCKKLPLALVLCGCLLPGTAYAEKLTFDEKVEIVRGLMAEYATAKTFLPRSKKPLEYDAKGTWEKGEWDAAAKQFGPAARVGDMVQITKVDLDDEKIVLEINGGMKSKRKWYENIEVGVGSRTTPINQRQTTAPGGTTIAILFHKPVPAMQASEIKKLLAPVLDFEKRSATEQIMDTLPPEIKQAVTEKRAIEGMDRDQVIMAMGKPRTKTRETKDGTELEDWIYGMPPGRVTFVTFAGEKVVRVKETYAGLGGQTAPPLRPVQ
jgi:hypothetical protein